MECLVVEKVREKDFVLFIFAVNYALMWAHV